MVRLDFRTEALDLYCYVPNLEFYFSSLRRVWALEDYPNLLIWYINITPTGL